MAVVWKNRPHYLKKKTVLCMQSNWGWWSKCTWL